MIINSIIQAILALIDIINFSSNRQVTTGFPITFVAILLVFSIIIINWSEILYYSDTMNDDICLSKRSIIITIISIISFCLVLFFTILTFALFDIFGRNSLLFIIFFTILFGLLVITFIIIVIGIIFYAIKIIIETGASQKEIFKMKFTQIVIAISLYLLIGVVLTILTLISTIIGDDIYSQVGGLILYIFFDEPILLCI